MLSSNQLTENYHHLLQEIDNTKRIYDRAGGIKLIAVTKTRSIQDIMHLYQLGQKDFGENYLQEAISKINAIEQQHKAAITWHYIGRIQSNKIKSIVSYFDWVHSVDSIKTAEKLDLYAKELNKKLNILLQVNIDQDDHKSGTTTQETCNIVQQINNNYPHLKIHGLMCMLRQDNDDLDSQRESFEKLDNLLKDVNQNLSLNLNTLSMGMSKDYKAAIAACQHNLMLRIGSNLFGARR